MWCVCVWGGVAAKTLGKRKVDDDSLAEWSKALASGASPQGRGFEPHCRHRQDLGRWGQVWGRGEGEKEGAGRGEEESHRRSYIPQAQKKWLETIGN